MIRTHWKHTSIENGLKRNSKRYDFFKNFLHRFHTHEFKAIKVEHYRDTSYDERGAPSTGVTYKCKYCHKIKVKNYFNAGYLNLKELNEDLE